MTCKINPPKRIKIFLVLSGRWINELLFSLNEVSIYMYLKMYCRELICVLYWPRRALHGYIAAQWDAALELNIRQL